MGILQLKFWQVFGSLWSSPLALRRAEQSDVVRVAHARHPKFRGELSIDSEDGVRVPASESDSAVMETRRKIISAREIDIPSTRG
ncbi:hypothetical protein C8F04DRAFT_1135360 [Mycena alexandri]|uniref:Uncharacterized protein n=1 Tax=Mycena alexandri TaxID=1745969 RepID=A0AAD6SCP5_9AGAR|nr:hypothetical protein C8F04DRAFT_1135360 [Mycena alexandri]